MAVLTHIQVNELVADSTFQNSMKVAISRTALAWLSEDPQAVGHDLKASWAKQALNDLDGTTRKLLIPVAGYMGAKTVTDNAIETAVVAVAGVIATK